MIDTTGTRTAEPSRRRWRVRDVVDPAIAPDLNETLSGLAANGDSRHAELSLRLDSIALLSLPISFETQPVDESLGEPSALAVGSPRRWIIVPPARDPAMQKRAWDFWLEAINSGQGEPRPSTRTMTVQRGAYLAGGETRIACAEFCAFDCTSDELTAMQRGDTDSLFFAKRLPSCHCETERLTLPLELAPQLRLAHRVSELWRDEFDEWRAFPPHYGWLPDGEDKPSVSLNLDTWCDAIGEGIKRIILDDLLSLSSIRNSEAATATQDAHPPSDRDRESNPNREEHIFRRRLLRILRGVNRPFEVAQRTVRRQHAKLPAATLHGGVVPRFVARFLCSFRQGWNEAIALYFSPLTALRRAIRRGLRRLRNSRQ